MSKQKTAIVSGFSGQSGSLMAQFLLSKGYKVYGMVRRVSNPNLDFIEEMGLQDVELVEADLSDMNSLHHIISNIQPDEFYNFASQSHVATSFTQPEYTSDTTGIGTLRILENIRLYSPHTRFYQASSSEIFGDVQVCPQNEKTELRPRSPYAVSKVYGHCITKVYRDAYNLFACSGIAFNHEGFRRSKMFVTRKITDWIGRYVNGKLTPNESVLKLGYLDAKRDWSNAKDIVIGCWMMLQHKVPDDYVLSSGKSYSVRQFVEKAFKLVDIDIVWSGAESNEKGIDSATGKVLIEVDPSLYRPAEVPILQGDYSKARKILGWEPQISFDDLVKEMVEYDCAKNNTNHTETIRAIN